MGQTINILEPTLKFGSFGIASIQVSITDNGVPVATRFYYFSVYEFLAVADSVSTNYASLHFGIQHNLDISNGIYSTYLYNGGSQPSAHELVIAVAEAVGAITP
jgi:hypothetical protein